MSDESSIVKAKPLSSRTEACSDVEFNVHTSCYNEFFLLRTPITINGRPAVIALVNEEPVIVLRFNGTSVKLSAILQQAVAPVASKHGAYQVDNFYHEQVALFSMKFQSKSSLKQFLTDKETVQEELSSAIANLFDVECTKATQPQSSQSLSMDSEKMVLSVNIEVEVYLVSPNVSTSPEVHRVNLVNCTSIFKRWQESKRFDFNSTMFTEQVINSGGDETAELADLQVELKEVIAWFDLGVQLKIPTHDLLAIRENQRTVEKCRLEMLVKWEQLEKPTWTKLFSALVNIGMKSLADNLAKKYGLSQPFCVAVTPAKDSPMFKLMEGEKKLSERMEQLKQAKHAQTLTSQNFNKELSEKVPQLQKKVTKLTNKVKVLQEQLKLRNKELEIFQRQLDNEEEEQSPENASLLEDKNEQIRSLEEELNQKKLELDVTKKELRDKEAKLDDMMEDLSAKSAQVFELETEVERLKLSLKEVQKEADKKLIEASAASVSHDKYLKELQIQRDIAMKEASKTKGEIQSYSQELTDNEKHISQLSEKIAEQEREMVKLQEELNSHHRTSEQLSTEQTREDDKKEQQLLTLLTTIIQLRLEQKKIEEQKTKNKLNLEKMKWHLEKYEREIAQANQRVETEASYQRLSEAEIPTAMERNAPSMEENQIAVNTATTRESSTIPSNVVALYDYIGRSNQELSFKKGDILQVTERKSTDWWYGMNNDGRQGYIPVNYVEIQQAESLSPNRDLTCTLEDNVRAKDELKLIQSEPHVHDSVQSKDTLLNEKEASLVTSLHQQSLSGGEIVQTPLSELKLPLNLKWRQGSDMPFVMRDSPSAVVMKGDVYMGGGDSSSSKDAQTVCVYSPSSDSWSQLPPYEYKWFSLTVINENQLVTVGGANVETYKRTNKLAVWDDKQCQWVLSLPVMKTACSSPAVATYNQWLLVAGGVGDQGDLSRVEVMNILSKQWYQIASLPIAGGLMSSTLIGNIWYIMGGFTNKGGSQSVMSICVEHIISEAISQSSGANSSTLSQWNLLPDAPEEIPIALAFQGALLAVGGISSSIYLYQPSTLKWIKAGDMPTEQDMPACTVLPNGHIMIAGGHQWGGGSLVYIAQVM